MKDKDLPTQSIGAMILMFAFAMALTSRINEAITSLIFVGIIDLYLIYIAGEKSISFWIRGLMPKYFDNLVMAGLLVLVWHVCSLQITIWFILGILSNHLFEIQNRS